MQVLYQQQHQFIQLTALKSMGVNVTDEELIDASNLHNKKKIKERIEGEPAAADRLAQSIRTWQQAALRVGRSIAWVNADSVEPRN